MPRASRCVDALVGGVYEGVAIMSDNGDALFAELFGESRVALRRYVGRFVRSREVADEIVQEAFLRTYEHAEHVKTPRAFLFSTARNLALDIRRHDRIARTETLGDFEPLNVVSESDCPEAKAEADEGSALLRDAVARLPPACRAAFTLKVFYAYSYKEIAAKLGISAKTVEHHIARGLRETHEYLRRHRIDANSQK